MFKQRKHIKSGTGTRSIDRYEDIDCFIPEAVRHADAEYPDRTEHMYNHKWTVCYSNEMDRMLAKVGLRVI